MTPVGRRAPDVVDRARRSGNLLGKSSASSRDAVDESGDRRRRSERGPDLAALAVDHERQ